MHVTVSSVEYKHGYIITQYDPSKQCSLVFALCYGKEVYCVNELDARLWITKQMKERANVQTKNN